MRLLRDDTIRSVEHYDAELGTTMPWKPLEEVTEEGLRDFRRRFPKKVRFLVDEDLGIGFTELLREMGYDAMHTSELKLSRRDDTQVLAGAKRMNRILLTHDRDFLDNRRHPIQNNPGTIVFPQGIEKSEV